MLTKKWWVLVLWRERKEESSILFHVYFIIANMSHFKAFRQRLVNLVAAFYSTRGNSYDPWILWSWSPLLQRMIMSCLLSYIPFSFVLTNRLFFFLDRIRQFASYNGKFKVLVISFPHLLCEKLSQLSSVRDDWLWTVLR